MTKSDNDQQATLPAPPQKGKKPQKNKAYLLRIPAILLTLFLLTYTFVDWCGERAWQRAKQKLKDAGEPVSWGDWNAPVQPDDEENYGAIPVLKHINDPSGGIKNEGVAFDLRKKYLAASLRPSPGDITHPHLPASGSLWFDQPTNLGKFAEYFENHKGAEHHKTPSETILVDLEKHAYILDGLRQGLDRPYAALSPSFFTAIKNDNGTLLNSPKIYLSPILEICKVLALRSIAIAHAETSTQTERDTALDSLRSILRLTELESSNSFLANHGFIDFQIQTMTLSLWECQNAEIFTSDQWIKLQRDIERIDREAMILNSLRRERLGLLRLFGQEIKSAGIYTKDMNSVLPLLTRCLPNGFFAGNRALMVDLNLKFVMTPMFRDGVAGVIQTGPQLMADYRKHKRLQILSPDGTLLPEDLIDHGGSYRRWALIQASLEMARTACALERYRLRRSSITDTTGQYPEKLNALIPDFLDSLPRDPLLRKQDKGGLLSYQKLPNGGYKLWGVGPDLKDDGGKIPRTHKRPKRDTVLPKTIYRGDWVWKVNGSKKL